MKRGHPKFYKLLEQMADLHNRKNANYANNENPLSNFYECEKFGIKAKDGTITRMSDKWSRLQQLWKGEPDRVGEPITDTLMDLAVYCLILIIILEDE